MILVDWTTMRQWLGRDLGTTDPDGVESWDVAKLRINGFDGTINFPTSITAFPFTITCNDGDEDAVLGVDEYDWYMAARTDNELARVVYLVEPVAPKLSGSVVVTLAMDRLGPLLPGATSASVLESDSLHRIFNRTMIYCQRRSDFAIQWIKPMDLLFPAVAE